MRLNRGVRARPGGARWSNAAGHGKVAAHVGCYDNAIRVKQNEFWLVIHEPSSGLNPDGVKLFAAYTARAKRKPDRTEYIATDSGAQKFAPHWAQLLSAAIVQADASRSLRAVDQARTDYLNARAAARMWEPRDPARRGAVRVVSAGFQCGAPVSSGASARSRA